MGKKEYGEFVLKLRKGLQEHLGLDQKQVYFMRQGPGITEAGDRLFMECVENDFGKEVCAVYTRELYEAYQEGMKVKEIVQRIGEEMEGLRDSGFFEKAMNLGDYEKIKDDLFIRLVNAEQEREELEQVVCRVVGDVAQVLYLRVDEEDDHTTSMRIRREYVKQWGMNEDVVFEAALINTFRTYPPRIFCWEGLIYDRDYRGEMFMSPIQVQDVHFKRTSMGNCLSTSHRTNGAVAVFYPGVAQRLAEMMGQDLYLVFTSVHEVMIHSASQCEVADLERALWATLRDTTPESEWLTTKIYRYCRATHRIICVSDGDSRMECREDAELEAEEDFGEDQTEEILPKAETLAEKDSREVDGDKAEKTTENHEDEKSFVTGNISGENAKSWESESMMEAAS